MKYQGIGLMSGTSGDGLDICHSQFEHSEQGWQSEILYAETKEYSEEWRHRLLNAHTLSGHDLAKVHVDFGHYQALLLRQVLVEQQLAPQWVAAHGHTIFHLPKDRHFTLQIGSGETLVSYLDCPLVTDFRTRDVAQGGEGAPLVPIGEQLLYPQQLFLNLGGIANLSAFNPGTWQLFTQRGPTDYMAFDVAPCNLVLNRVAAQLGHAYDKDGAWAAEGTLIQDLFAALEALPFYYMPPPRSLGREFVDEHVWPLVAPHLHQPKDVLATVCEHIASRLAAEVDRYQIRDTELLITGGGAFNVFLVDKIKQMLKTYKISVLVPDEQQVSFKEAHIFAFLGLLNLTRKPNILPKVTGARKAVIGGSIHLPESYHLPLLSPSESPGDA